MKKALLIAGVLAAVMMVQAQQASETKPGLKPDSTEAKPSEPVGSLYKFDLVIEELQNGKVINGREYSWTCELYNGKPKSDNINIGDRIPITTAVIGEKGQQQESFQYIDVGTVIHYRAFAVEDRVIMDLGITLSSITAESQTSLWHQPVIRQTKSETSTILSPGKPMMIFSLDDPGTTGHYVGKLTVTKIKD